MKTTTTISISIATIGLLAIAALVYLASRPGGMAPQPQSATEKPLVQQINDVRAKAGKPPVKEDPMLDQAAKEKATLLAQTNTYGHQLPSGEPIFAHVLSRYPGVKAGENLAECQHSDSERVKDWVNSPEHYSIMIGDYQGFGWAEVVNPQGTCIWAVTYFVKY